MATLYHTSVTPAEPSKKEVVLEIKNLRIHYETPRGDVIAVNGISFKVYRGEIVGLVGESGCGKTTAAMGILQLVQSPGRIIDGEIRINNDKLARPQRTAAAPAALARPVADPAGRDELAQPGDESLRSDCGRDHHARRPPAERQAQAAHPGPAQPGRAAGARVRPISARIERRHETACVHCHGHCALATADHRRRTDERAGCGGAARGCPDACWM